MHANCPISPAEIEMRRAISDFPEIISRRICPHRGPASQARHIVAGDHRVRLRHRKRDEIQTLASMTLILIGEEPVMAAIGAASSYAGLSFCDPPSSLSTLRFDLTGLDLLR